MSLNKEQMVKLFTNLVRSDHFDKMMYRRMMQGKLIGFYHPGGGGLAPGVAACTFLNPDDNMVPHIRAHGMAHNLSKGADLKYFLAEHTGKATGCCQAHSTFHCCFPEVKSYMLSGFIGFNFAPSVGWGWAAKRRGIGQVVMCCSGDGSYGQGRSHEAMLMAQNWKLPIIFSCENNGKAIHSSVSEMHPTEDISSLAQGYGMPAVVVDGQDVFAVAEVMLEAIKYAREGKGPTFVESKTIRFSEHDIGTPNLDGWEQRSAEEIEHLKKREPLILATERVLGDGILIQGEIDAIHESAKAEVDAAEIFADESPIARKSEEELLSLVYAP